MNFEQHKRVLEQSPYGYALQRLILDDKGNPCDLEFIELNSSFKRLLGMGKIDLIHKKFTDIVGSDVFKWYYLLEQYGQVVQQSKTIEFDYYSVSNQLTLSVTAFPVEKDLFATFIMDITEMLQHKEIIGKTVYESYPKEVKLSPGYEQSDGTQNRQLMDQINAERHLFSSGPVAVFIWLPKEGWPIEYVSKNIHELMGYPSAMFYSEKFKFEQLIHPDDLSRVKQEVERFRNLDVSSYEQSYRLMHSNGTYQWYYDFTVPEKDDKGVVTRLRGYIFNQTRLKQIEMDLEKERLRLQNILDGTQVGTWEWEIQTGKLMINERWAELIGYTLEELEPISIQVLHWLYLRRT